MKKFEYHYIIIDNAKIYLEKTRPVLNELGREGWELVGVCPAHDGLKCSCIFKRELQGDNIQSTEVKP